MLQPNEKDKIEYVALYCRVANANPFSGEAVKMQQTQMLRWLGSSGISPKSVHTFVDTGNSEQTALTEMMQEMKLHSGKAFVVVVSASRFSRNPWTLHSLIQTADEQGILLYTIKENSVLNKQYHEQTSLCAALLKGGAVR